MALGTARGVGAAGDHAGHVHAHRHADQIAHAEDIDQRQEGDGILPALDQALISRGCGACGELHFPGDLLIPAKRGEARKRLGLDVLRHLESGTSDDILRGHAIQFRDARLEFTEAGAGFVAHGRLHGWGPLDRADFRVLGLG